MDVLKKCLLETLTISFMLPLSQAVSLMKVQICISIAFFVIFTSIFSCPIRYLSFK